MNKEGPQFKKHYSVGPGEFPNGSNKTLQFDLPLKMYRVFCHKTKLFAIIFKTQNHQSIATKWCNFRGNLLKLQMSGKMYAITM